jgi:hypothetical protein
VRPMPRTDDPDTQPEEESGLDEDSRAILAERRRLIAAAIAGVAVAACERTAPEPIPADPSVAPASSTSAPPPASTTKLSTSASTTATAENPPGPSAKSPAAAPTSEPSKAPRPLRPPPRNLCPSRL